ncbi:bidirectional sugar transporter SWEET2 isoform X2 [Juglans microcarpa x Juglans regia]|uniref:bidirectional sugar transporter SWEET2 isoform X2 n=1 Tax=Juglans microcarpa x Juglans regia TaxID=2249226 RepID=UPI001B7DBA6A|nr:bidirectional sugar transporter SWEET2 isoform X2 [Juglans microcarpa x Juglans regia]
MQLESPGICLLLGCLCPRYPLLGEFSETNRLNSSQGCPGAVFQLIYIILFITYAEKGRKVRMLVLLLAVFGLLAIVVAGSLQILDRTMRWIFVGLLSGASLISMFASPLFIINLVIRTKSVEFMPFYLSLSTFLMSTCFFLYGLFNDDVFIYVPNGIGTILGIVQLVLYFFYSRRQRGDSTEPLIVSYG